MFFGNNKKNVRSEIAQATSRDVGTSSAKVTLTKAKEGLEHHIVSLKKEGIFDFSNHRARVFVVLDRSGSMCGLYKNGAVQNTLTRLLPLALKFDDNGELEVYLFNNSYTQLSSMTLKNYENYVENEILRKGLSPNGGTSYAPVINKTISDYNARRALPAFGIFITDGENSDPSQTDAAIRASSKYRIFYQFIGIGNERFTYLKKLDDLSGRAVDNTAFVRVSDFASLNDEQLYQKILEQYPDWLRAMHIN